MAINGVEISDSLELELRHFGATVDTFLVERGETNLVVEYLDRPVCTP